MKKNILLLLIISINLSAQNTESWNELILMDIGPRLCNATSTLDNSDWKLYNPTNLFDYNVSTSWAVGNGGIGTKIYMILDENTSAITVANGIQKSKIMFQQNNRVKKMNVSVLYGFSYQAYVTEIGRIYQTKTISKTKQVILKDAMTFQTIKFPFVWKDLLLLMQSTTQKFDEKLKSMNPSIQKGMKKKEIRNYILCIEIKDIYRGTKFNNTCISEISFSKE